MATLQVYCDNAETAEMYRNYKPKHAGDAGIDLHIPHGITVPAKALSFKIDHMLHCKLTDAQGHGCSFLLLPRSSICKSPLRMCNSIGLIDSEYRGSLIAFVDNMSDAPVRLTAGERLFQVCSPLLEPMRLEVVSSLDELGNTTRNQDGFGSTGGTVMLYEEVHGM